jgi:hypothetical protein
MRKTLLAVVLSLSLLSSALWAATQGAGTTHAYPLPCWGTLPGTWTLHYYQYESVLTVGQLDPTTGNFTGTVFNQPLIGHFNCTTQKIAFVRAPSLAKLDTVQWYTGVMDTGNPYKLQGTFRTFTSVTGQEPDYPWVADKWK